MNSATLHLGDSESMACLPGFLGQNPLESVWVFAFHRLDLLRGCTTWSPLSLASGWAWPWEAMAGDWRAGGWRGGVWHSFISLFLSPWCGVSSRSYNQDSS